VFTVLITVFAVFISVFTIEESRKKESKEKKAKGMGCYGR
jgi:large-conductance mechanosensitive channel